MTSLEEARAALDRAVEAIRLIEIPDPKNRRLVERTAQATFGAVCRLVSLVQRNIHLARVAEESGADHRQGLALLHADERRELARMRRLRNEIVAKYRELNPSAQVANDGDGPSLVTSFDEFLEKGLKRPGQEDSFFANGKHKAAERLWQLLDHVDEHEPRLPRWKDRCAEASNRMASLRRAQHVLDKSSPGKSWLWIGEVPGAANPPNGPKLWESESHSLYESVLGPVYKLVHDPRSVNERGCERACEWLTELRASVNVAATDFQARLGQRASTTWVLERYARRCRRLRRDDLSQMLAALPAKKKRDRERALARDAAVFLFDQGFEVLTEQSMGTHRYDVVGEPLLVEAKIYERRGRAAVVDGLAQIHQYANALADEGVKVDPVLLVFRLGGPRATPVPNYKIGNLRVTIAHVDLGTSSDSGREAPPPEPDITEEAITAALRPRHPRGTEPAANHRPKRTR